MQAMSPLRLALERVCENEWCKQTYKVKDFENHAQQCELKRPMSCFKCGKVFAREGIKAHSGTCVPTPCSFCKTSVIERLLKYCPLHIKSTKLKRSVAVYNLKDFWNRSCAKFKSPNDIAAGKIQHCYRLVRMRVLFYDIIFRVILREMEVARESLIVTKRPPVETEAGGPPVAPQKRRSQLTTKCAHQDIPQGHYFPRDASPITMAIVKMMLDDFERGVRLPYAAAWRICDEALSHLCSLRNVQHVTPPEGARSYDGRWAMGGKIVVVGDLHGQLHDLLHIINENGLPDMNKGTYYIFNGDFVDRGANSVEILLGIYGMMIACPGGVFLNRGNHEVFYMNEDYGFDVEVTTKYDRPMYHLIQRTFNALPLCTCVSRRVLVLHGGVPRLPGITLEFIDTIKRFRPMPMPETDQPEEDVAFQDILWSDPWDLPGIGVSERGAGTMFGKDITERFLEDNNLRLIIRSHEPFLKGYEEHHDGKVVTIFSASNYDGDDSNKASYAVITAARPDQPSYHTYRVRDIRELTLNTTGNVRPEHTTLQSSALDEVLRHIREKIYIKRHQLLKFFNAMDITRRGTIWKVEWVEAMRTVLSMEVPWFFLRMFLAEVEDDSGRINYMRFLWRYQNRLMMRWMKQLEKVVVNKVSCALDKKRDAFVAQLTSSTTITFMEFERILHSLDIGIRDEELFQLFTFFDREFDGHLPVDRILQYLSKQSCNPTDSNLWELECMQELQNMFISGRMSLEHAFRAMDGVGKGTLDMGQFVKGMTMLNRTLRIPLEPHQMKDLYECVDIDKDGVISFNDFVDSFSVQDVVYDMSIHRHNSSFVIH
jgi:diadenosine tetraphosphatase ApaH/serine/threonine PP2A family protein phosphatase/Ca2+-binding EF-hand superfamily protein